MKSINRFLIKVLLLSIPMVMALQSCDSGDNPESAMDTPVESCSIVGEWFENASDDESKMYQITRYNEDGTYTALNVTINSSFNLIFDWDGTYSYENGLLTENYVFPFSGENNTDIIDVKYIDKYSLICYLEKYSSFGEQHRIVANYEMNVGDTKVFELDDANFIATEYVSAEPTIAPVDKSGKITALRRGVAYISAISDLGEAVIKVTVTDPDNYIDDFTIYLGKRIEEPEKVYGSMYEDGHGDVFSDK